MAYQTMAYQENATLDGARNLTTQAKVKSDCTSRTRDPAVQWLSNFRFRCVMAVVAVAAALLAGSVMFGVLPARSAQPEKVVTYVVQPGDTLWKYAKGITPADGDVRDSVAKIMRLNHMSTPQVMVGQKLKVPQK